MPAVASMRPSRSSNPVRASGRRHRRIHPFGEVSCEQEKEVFGEEYRSYFFEYAPFNPDSLDESTYLIVGRRGCGKTSLAEYFNFQTEIADCRCVEVDEPRTYSAILKRVVSQLDFPSEIAIPHIAQVWKYAIWALVFRAYREEDPRIQAAAVYQSEEGSASAFVKTLLAGLFKKYVGANVDELTSHVDQFLNDKVFHAARTAVLEIANERPVIIALDSMDHYSVGDRDVVWATAALVQAASDFHDRYSRHGIHIKVFLTDEFFPYLLENAITNPLKYVRHPLFLHWRPKDLVRLVSWRFHRHLVDHGHRDAAPRSVRWESFRDVWEKMWEPFFGRFVNNRHGVPEPSFPYVLRHTQMRPRQLVILCNEIANEAVRQGTFPNFPSEVITRAVHRCEVTLATEVINSYCRIYPNIGNIVSALNGLPMRFDGRLLDRVAKRTASQWEDGDYSLDRFRRVMAEIGIVGRQRGEPDQHAGVVEADFEFLMEDRLFVSEEDPCVIHPMFYRKVNIKTEKMTVYPFPDHPDYQEVRRGD